MKINRIFTALLALVMMVSIVPVFTVNTVAASGDDWTPPLSIVNNMTTADKRANKLPVPSFDEEKCLYNWNANGQRLTWLQDENGGYIKASGIILNYIGFKYSSVFEVEPGTYKFTGYLRTANKGEIGCQRIQIVQFNADGSTGTNVAAQARVYIGNDWQYVEFYAVLDGYLSHILVNGGGYQWYIQDFCMDQFTFSKVDEIPSDAKSVFGTPNTHEEARDSMQKNWNIKPYDPVEEAKWDVSGGIIINRDDCLHMSADGITYNDIVRYAKQFEGTHVTDYFLNINSDRTSMISPSITDDLELYHRLKENGQYDTLNSELKRSLDGAHHIYETLKTDDYGVLIETFREIGINPWISIRMNDVHDKSTTYKGIYNDPSGKNPILSDFFYNNPQFYRVRHHSKSYSNYFDQAYDWAFPEVQKFYLSLINDALNRYDMYGLELDWMRECRLFGIGGEYNGLDILNQFMRDLDDLIAIYEEKYGHKIKVAARVPSDPMTCYDFGLDPMTWIAERTIDMIIPASRYENNDGDIPVKLWCSMADPHGVEVAMCIEYNANKAWAGGPSVTFNIETLAGLASKAYSQGADYIYFYNNFPAYTTGSNMLDLKPEEKIVTDEPSYMPTPGDSVGYWNMLTTLGSPDKLLTFNRRYLISYNDTVQVWWNNNYNNQVPRTVSASGQTSVFRIPVGDVAEGSRMFVKFSTDYPEIADFTNVEQPPLVWVNSEACEYVKISDCDYGWTSNKVLTYEIPAEAHDGGYAVIEISATDQRYPFTIDYMEIYVQAHD